MKITTTKKEARQKKTKTQKTARHTVFRPLGTFFGSRF